LRRANSAAISAEAAAALCCRRRRRRLGFPLGHLRADLCPDALDALDEFDLALELLCDESLDLDVLTLLFYTNGNECVKLVGALSAAVPRGRQCQLTA
jgi:hypothetical protein